MQPRTKLQKAVVKSAQKLPPLSAFQFKQARKHIAPHIAKLTVKGVYTCLDCGRSWKDEKADNVTCPHCGAKLEVDATLQRSWMNRDYFMTITTCDGFQVMRMYLLTTKLSKGKEAQIYINEVFQRWVAPDGKYVIRSLKRQCISMYYDAWSFNSELELREESRAHTIIPCKIIGATQFIPQLKRNGFNGQLHGCSPHDLIPGLLSNNKLETLWKIGQYNLVKWLLYTSADINRYWPAIKVALHHHYHIKDASMWGDLLQTLHELGKDLHNPQFICPQNLKAAHDEWLNKLIAKREREREQHEREREAQREQQYLSHIEQVAQDEANYRREKSKFFDLVLTDAELSVKPLVSIQEFIDEGKTHHHCVFANGYYKQSESLILHALVRNVSVATIELSLRSLEVIQCRGKYNSKPVLYDRIINLIKANKSKIAQKLTA